MRIKSLTLIGFKSFPERTTFSFEPGITAVVGPNGCGKSNLVDAVRWALGEQSPRLLRGRVMEDVIFKGSDSRKPLGMAEAMLTFAETQGLSSPLVKGRPEVMVSRRLYRSGESEYAINKVSCRLKDITDLFLDQGVSHRLYSIIEQGQINQILTGKGEERRALIEEAAGVSKYRERKRETLLKLEGTRLNLARVDDVMGEVKRQMNSLKRQASAAEKYQRLQEEIRALDIMLARQRYEGLEEVAGGHQQELAEIHGEVQALSARLKEKETELASLRSSLQQKERAKKQAEEKVAECKARTQHLQTLIISLNREAEFNQRQQEKTTAELSGIESRLGEMRTEAQELQRELARLKETSREIQRKIAEVEGLGETVHSQHREEEQKLEQAKVETFDLHRRLVEVTTQLKGLRGAIEQGKIKKEKNRQETASVLEKLERLEGERALVLSKIRALREEITLKEKVKEEKEQRLGRSLEVLAQKKGEAEEVERARDQLAFRLASLKEMEQALEGYQTPVRSFLSAASAGIRGLVVDLIQVEQKYEMALVAALGERLQYLVVDDLSRALELLPIREGRVGFIPAHIQPGTEPVPVPTGEGILGSLSELVKAPAHCRQAIEYLLNPWLLVSDLGSALKLRQQGFEGMNIVTLNGEIVERAGILITPPSPGPDMHLLARKREIRELGQRATAKETELSQLLKEVAGLENETQAQREELEILHQAVAEHRAEVASCEQQLRWHEQEEARARETIHILKSEAEELEKEMAAALSTIEEAAEAERKLTAAREAKEAELESLRNSEETLRNRSEALGQQLAQLKVQAAALEEREQGLNFRLAKLEELTQEQQQFLNRKEAEYIEIQKELERIGAELTNATQEQGSLRLSANQAEGQVNQAIQDYEQTAAAFDQCQESLKDMERALSQTREEARDKEFALAQRRMELSHIQERIRESYNLDLEGELPAPEPGAELEVEEAQPKLQQLREEASRIGQVNFLALEEYQTLRERFELLARERKDIFDSLDSLEAAIKEIDQTCREKFQETFILANQKFNELFRRLFQGGRAQLALTGEGDPLECGVEMMVEPPGKRLQNALLLSTGEKALAAIALIFSLFLIKPSPFCFLDELDAPLDDANIARLNSLIKEIAEVSQLIIITHNKRTMEAADALYGITMEEAGVSKLVSVKLN